MIYLSTLIKYTARRVKTSVASTQVKVSNETKTKFSDDQILQMAGFKHGGRSAVKVFKEKIQDRAKENKQKQQEHSEDQQVESEDREHPQFSYQKMAKKHKSQYQTFRSPHIPISQRVTSQEISLKQLSRIRLQPQYLPMYFMQKVKKVFHKYSQPQLRQIAEHFAKYTKLRYSQEKIDYEAYEDLGFQKLEYKTEQHGGPKPQQPIYLIGRSKIYDQPPNQQSDEKKRRVDDDPLNTDVSYTQNIVISYLLLRVPKTYAVANRILTQIKYKFNDFKPTSFIDFGAGLSSGCLAYLDTFQYENTTHQVYAVEPAPKMRKMSQYLLPDKVQYFKSLGQLSVKVKQVDIVYAGYVMNQIDSQLVEVYLQSLWAKVKNQGFLVLVQHGNPFGARLIHQARKWILNKNNAMITAPCPHHMRCPLARTGEWCHFDQPVGMYPREVFGKLPNDNQIKSQKFSYLVIQKTLKDEFEQEIKPNVTNDWDRVVFPLIKRGGHFALNLCTKKGTFERRVIAKSHGEEYNQGKKLRWGDLWRFGKRIPNKFRKERKTGKRLW